MDNLCLPSKLRTDLSGKLNFMSGECESEVKVTILIEAVIYTVRTVNLRGRREFDENLALLGEEFTFWSFLNNFVIL